MNNDVKLKVKAKSLAAESKFIRKEEKKLTGEDNQPMRESLAMHRRWNVRNESRATGLARAYLKGVPYQVVEPSCKDTMKRSLVLSRVLNMANKYGLNKCSRDDLAAWVK